MCGGGNVLNLVATWFLYFVIYSFLGWMCETVYCSIPARHFINRGFLNGPFCPIYGVGGIVTIAVLEPFISAPAVVFLLGVVWTSLLEYATSWGMEVLFHYKWWDYSNRFLNIRGRVCLLNSVLFGILCVVLMYFIHPPVERFLLRMSVLLKTCLSGGLAVYFIADLIVTVKAVLNLNQRLEKLHMLKEEISAGLKDKLDSLESPSVRFKRLIEERRIFQHRLIRSFPHLKSSRYNEHLQKIKEAVHARRKGKKADRR